VLKKLLPFAALFAAAFLLYWIKKHQGTERKQPNISIKPVDGYAISRDTGKLLYSKHALCRMDCRHIDKSEVKDILINGKLNEQKIEESEKGISYPLEGYTADNQHVRVVFAPHENETIVVTVIDLDKEWPCNCR